MTTADDFGASYKLHYSFEAVIDTLFDVPVTVKGFYFVCVV
jgi:hypothetical protein